MLIAVTSQLPLMLATAGVDFYTHDTYFVLAPRYAFLGFALLCGLIGGLYYLGDRASGNRLHKGLTLAHFLFWIFAVLISFAVEFTLVRTVLGGHDPSQFWLVLAESASVAAFVIGALLFAVNFAWALVRKLRAS